MRKLYIDYDENGKIESIFEPETPVENMEYFEVDDDFNTLTYLSYKIENHKMVPITHEEKVNLYWDGVDIEAERAIKEEKEKQEDLLYQMYREAFLNSLSDEQAAQVPLLFQEWDDKKVYEAGERFIYDGQLYKAKTEQTIPTLAKLNKLTETIETSSLPSLKS